MIRQAENQVVKKRGRPKKNSDIPILNNIENIEEDLIFSISKKIIPKENNNDKENKEKEMNEINKMNNINELPLLSISESIEDENKKNKKDRKNNVECIKINEKKNKRNKKEKENDNMNLSIYSTNSTNSINSIHSIEKRERGLFENKIFIYNINCPFKLNPDNTIILEKTNIGCLWDTYEINDIPYFLPDHMRDGKFYIIGWFCSLNCAISYNIRLNDEKVLERINLLKYMYNIDGEHITPSPDILVLKKFGGFQDINEYRNKLSILKSSQIVYKPMICLSPMYEETFK